ncbi:MAG: chromosome segregation protein SMC [Candidatus Eremiobacteraeota bacterium]|nr:chromosome segregation protein SMC [Candidatus Eremiobacteraeota bacterium]
MYLKSIDLFGFKTFAERTRLIFEPGISAIVGPNGSGKSNLVDAVRWTLGEQSAKQLRGGRMDDVIFAGNNRRRPLGMSEVTLTFDNSDGALPTPFAEIAVTRRVYRNGEGEYFLNKSQVRLRDIMDLLLGTGLGPDASAIISQGEIDAILSAKPLQRREVFEEVAGTSKYQARKHEAQRRLEQTDANALRVNDLLTELERQVPAIEQQVRRAKRYQKVVQRLRDFEILSFVRNTQTRRGEREQIAAALNAQEAQRAATDARRAMLEAELSKARHDEYQATLALDERNAARAQAATLVQEAASALATAQARVEEVQRRSETLAREVDSAAREVTAADEEIAALQSALARAREERDAAMRAVDERAIGERAAAATWEQAYDALRAIEDRRAAMAASAAEVDATTQAHLTHRGRLADSVQRVETELQGARERRGAHERRMQGLREGLAASDAALQRAAEEIERAAAARDGAQRTLESARAEVERKRAGAIEAAARLRALEDIAAAGHDRPAGARAVLEAAAAGTLSGIIGALSDRVETDAPYALAIDVALGSSAHAVITKTSAHAHAAIEHLKKSGAGRATFMPLDAVRQQELPLLVEVGKRDGVVGHARDLVRCPDEVRPAMEYALANVVVADSLALATKLAREFPHATIVTLTGDVAQSASLTGGSRDDERGPLSRRAAIADLERTLKRAQSDVTQAESSMSQARTSSDQALKAADAALALRNEAQAQRLEAFVAVERAAAEIVALEQQAASLEKQLADARAALENVEAQWRTHDRRHEQGRAAIDAVEAERAAAAAASSQLQQALDDLREQHRSAAARAAGLVERVAQAGDDVEHARNRLAERREAHAQRLAAVAELRDDETSTRALLDGARERRAQADAALLEAERDAQSLRDTRDALVAGVRELEGRLNVEQSDTKERSLELERQRIRLAEIDAELSVLAQQFAQNPATPQECDDVAQRHAAYEGDVDSDIRRMRDELARLGGVNLNALEDQAALLERRDFLRTQLMDLERARASILAVIADIDAESVRQFNAVFEKVSAAFGEMFARLFAGGVGKIWLAQSDDPALAGVEIAAQPPGKKMQSLNALSGGERALTAVALIFAILSVRPSPFYIFDEIDAALDEANIGRFGAVLAEFANRAQIVIITHNKATMTLADRIYGVTMGEPGVSNLLSLALEQVGA